MPSAYETDRSLWNSSASALGDLRFTPWKFSGNSVRIGQRIVSLHDTLLPIIATFDVFCCSTLRDVEHNPCTLTRKETYYLLLRSAVTTELEIVSDQQKLLDTSPKSMNPWLWRTALGYFDHDDNDNEKLMNLYDASSSLYDEPFPNSRKQITLPAWTPS